MKMKIDESNRIYLYRVLCVITVVVALFPVSCNYIMDGGNVAGWIVRMEEIAEGLSGGNFYLFPSAELFANTEALEDGMNSNLWFLIPGILYHIFGSMVLSYRVLMLAIQIGTLLAAMLFFQSFFAGRESRFSVFCGVLLYMTCPYRIYVCYDSADLSQAVAWALLPLYVWALVGITSRDTKPRDIVMAALALAGIGYADVRFFVILGAITLLIGLVKRKLWMFVSLAVGGVFFFPGTYRLIQYLFMGRFMELNLPIQSIMDNGYRMGEFFSSYAYKGGHPGMGLGILVCLLTGIWLYFVKGETDSGSRLYTSLSVSFLLLSFYRFPWDFLQRLGIWSLKLISLMETPALFAGLAFGSLCVVGASAAGRFFRREEGILTASVSVFILLACLGLCIYQCNTLTYNRLPLSLP